MTEKNSELILKFNDIEKMLEVAKATLLEDKPVVLLFIGTVNTSTNKSWCSDCDNAKPLILECLKELDSIPQVLAIEVGTREEWRADYNPFRNHRLFDLTCIPTLIRLKLKYDELLDCSRLSDSESQIKEKVLNFLSNNNLDNKQ